MQSASIVENDRLGNFFAPTILQTRAMRTNRPEPAIGGGSGTESNSALEVCAGGTSRVLELDSSLAARFVEFDGFPITIHHCSTFSL